MFLLFKTMLAFSYIASGNRVRVMFTPSYTNFYIVKLRFTGVYLFFLFLIQNIGCGQVFEKLINNYFMVFW